MDSKFPDDYEHHIAQIFQTPELRSEIKAFLRHRLFTTVQNSSLGPCLSRKDVQPVSPKLQTINLLVAEYLLRNRHHFTLSVFACEVPSVSCLSPSLQDTLRGLTCTSAVPFKQEDLLDMLDTLGIARDSPEGQELKRKYVKNQQPLLECLIRILPALKDLVISSDRFRDEATNTEPHTACLESVAEERKREIDTLQRAHSEELKLLRLEFAGVAASTDRQLQQLSEKHAEELSAARVHQREEQRLKDLVSSLQDKLKLAEETSVALRIEKATEVQRIEQDKVNHHNELESLKEKLRLREISLSEETRRIEKEKDVLMKVKKKLQVQQRHIDDVTVALAHSQTENLPGSSLVPALELELHAKEQELSELKSNMSKLNQENKSLRNFIERQKRQLDSLNVKSAELVSELHAARDQLHTTRSRSSRYRTSSSDSSPTDDVIKDAKKRMKSLEEEFEAIGRHHKNFQVRHMNDSFLSSVHGSSSGQILMSSHNITPVTSFLPNLSTSNVESAYTLSPRRHHNQIPMNQSILTPKSHRIPNHSHSTPVSFKQESKTIPRENGVHFEVPSTSAQVIHTPVQRSESITSISNLEEIKELSCNSNDNSNKIETAQNSIGPSGDAPPLQPVALQSPILVNEETLIINSTVPISNGQSVQENKVPSTLLVNTTNESETSKIVSETKVLFSKLVESSKEEVFNENKLPVTKQVTDVKVDELNSTSSSSSSKHVSHGATNVDVDDFWNM